MYDLIFNVVVERHFISALIDSTYTCARHHNITNAVNSLSQLEIVCSELNSVCIAAQNPPVVCVQ